MLDRVHERIQRLEQRSTAREKLIGAQESGILLTPEEQAAIFGEKWNPERSSRRSYEAWEEIAHRTAQWK